MTPRPRLSVVREHVGSRGSESGPREGEATAGEVTLESAFRRYAPYVARIAYRLLGRYQDVEDVVQDVFADAVKGLRQLKNPQAVKAWLASVTVRTASRRLKMRRLQQWLRIEAVPDFEGVEAPTATPDQRALLTSVYRILGTVPVKARVAWVLRTMEGEDLETIAATCGCSLATVKRRVRFVQARIEEALDDD